MNFRLSKYSIVNISCFFQLLLISMHIATSEILVYLLLLLFIPLNAFFIFYLNKINIKELVSILIFFLAALFFGMISPVGFNELFVSWLMAVYSVFFSILFLNKNSVNYMLVFILAFNFYIFYLAIKSNFDPAFGNEVFFNKSRNYVSATLSIFTIMYLILVRYFDQKINLLVLIILAINSFFLFGRSGIVVGFLLLLFGIYYKLGKKVFIFLSILSSIFLGVIFSYLSTQTNFGEGLDSPRTALKNEYLNYIFNDPYSLFFGANLNNCCTLIASYGFNPHNSFLMGHSIYGVGVIIFIIFSSCLVILSKRLDFLILYVVLILRYSLDSIGIFTYYDTVFFLLLYASYLNVLSRRGERVE